MVCINDPTQIHLEGQFYNDYGKFFRVELHKCQNTTSDGRPCIQDEEQVSKFIKETFIFMFHNSQSYAVDEYSDFVIEEHLKVDRFNLGHNLYY